MLTRAVFVTGLLLFPTLAYGQQVPDPDALQARVNVLMSERDQLESNLSTILVQLNTTTKTLQKANSDLSACQAKLPKEAAPSTEGQEPATK